MKKIHFQCLMLVLISLFFACNVSKKSSSVNEEKTVWIKSTHFDTVSYGNANSGLYLSICLGINDKEKLNMNQFGYVEAEWKPLCGIINGFDYEEGNYYRIKIKKIKDVENYGTKDVELAEWKLLEILSKEKDVHYQKRREYTVWIGPQKIEARCGSPMAPPDCKEMRHQVQYGELDKNGTWKAMYDLYSIPDYEEGYIYRVKYTKVYLSESELKMIADHRGFEVENVEVVSKEKY